MNAPDILISKDDIQNQCMACHKRRQLVRSKKHKPILAGNAVENKYCTDCHGQHKMAQRTVRWDKETRELIVEE